MILPSVPSGSTVLAAAAAAAYVLLAVARLGAAAGWGVLLLAWLLHAGALAFGLGLGGAGARFGFAPALSVTVWLVFTVYAVESQVFPRLAEHRMLAVLGALAVLLALLFPGQPLHAADSPWLPLHWALGIAAYGLFAAAVAHAALMTRAERQIRRAARVSPGLPLLTLERLTFRLIGAGFALLTATLLAGWLFSEQLYGAGHAWKWNHKTVFSLLAWTVFAVLLLGRWRFGWRGLAAVRVLYVGAGLLLLAYVGSRFVLEVVLGRVIN